MRSMHWKGAEVTVDGCTFLAALFVDVDSSPDRLAMWKQRSLVESLSSLLDTVRPSRIVELGIAKGGSTGFLAAYARPSQLLAVERDPDRLAVLDEFLAAHDLDSGVRTEYGLDQGDSATLRALVDEVFGEDELDLVLDDASHELTRTRRSFEVLFPRLRPGGVYAIEDWQWGNDPRLVAARGADAEMQGWVPPGQPLALLVFELILAAGGSDLVASVEVDEHYARIERGPAPAAETFKLEDLYPAGASTLIGQLPGVSP